VEESGTEVNTTIKRSLSPGQKQERTNPSPFSSQVDDSESSFVLTDSNNAGNVTSKESGSSFLTAEGKRQVSH
jgi:hypothetical protein